MVFHPLFLHHHTYSYHHITPLITPPIMASHIPFVTQASSSSEEEEEEHEAPVPSKPAACAIAAPPVASFQPIKASTPCRHPKPLVQTNLLGQKVKDTPHRTQVRQFKKKSGFKVRAHSRKPTSKSQKSNSQSSRNPHPPSIGDGSLIGSHIDATDAKIINSLLIQDKLDTCKARIFTRPPTNNS